MYGIILLKVMEFFLTISNNSVIYLKRETTDKINDQI